MHLPAAFSPALKKNQSRKGREKIMSGNGFAGRLSRRNVILAGAGLLATATVAGPAAAQDAGLVAAAEKEGALVVYGDLNATPVLIESFNKKYPKIRVTSARGNAWQMYNRHLSEKAAGRPVLDVFYQGEDTLLVASNAGELMDYKPAEAKNFPAEATPAGKHYVLGNSGICMLAWNGDAMKGKPTPKDWTDFANPPEAWTGLIGLADPITSAANFAVVAGLVQHYGKDKAAEIFKGIMKVKPDLSTNIGVQVTKLETGERPLALFVNTSSIAVLRGKGVPVEFAVPASGAIAQYNAIAITKTAPHPNAAKLFVEHALSEAGQAALAAANLYPVRTGAAPPKGMPTVSEIKFMPVDLEKALQQRDDLLNWWQDVTGYRIR